MANLDCFVIMPFGEEGTEKRNRFDKVYNLIIKDSITKAGYECIRALEDRHAGNIVEKVKKELASARLVLADLSEFNANVFYELGFRHALRKPVITIYNSEGNKGGLPLSISQHKTIYYNLNDFELSAKCKAEITKLAKDLLDTQSDASDDIEEVHEPTNRDLEIKLEIGLSNILGLIAEGVPVSSHETENKLQQLIDPIKAISAQVADLQGIKDNISKLINSSSLLQQANNLGVVSIYRNRPDAIDEEFYRKMQNEDEGIDIVGSTIFGLQGKVATNGKIIELLRSKAADSKFTLRILLTHWDYVSGRQAQEKTEKNSVRYVISKELLDAVNLLKSNKLEHHVKFYKGAPTCFTIICRGQRQMLLNPYPYEREAFNSWSIIFKETFEGIFNEFQESHFNQPWKNKVLSVKFNDNCLTEIEEQYDKELWEAKEELKEELEKKLLKKPGIK